MSEGVFARQTGSHLVLGVPEWVVIEDVDLPGIVNRRPSVMVFVDT